jgi:hypothetical protein
LLIAGLFRGCGPLFFESGEVDGRVVELQSQNPIANAVVLVVWTLQRGRLFHGSDYRILRKEEALTDECGIFTIPAWSSTWVGFTWSLSGSTPTALILKPHYGGLEILNGEYPSSRGVRADVTDGVHRQSRVVVSWSGENISLRESTLSSGFIDLIADEYLCREGSWRQTPILAAYLMAEHDWTSCLDHITEADRKMLRERAKRLLEGPTGPKPTVEECTRRHPGWHSLRGSAGDP